MRYQPKPDVHPAVREHMRMIAARGGAVVSEAKLRQLRAMRERRAQLRVERGEKAST